MSILYYTKVNHLEVTLKPIQELVKQTYHSNEDNFRHRLSNCGLDLTKEPRKIRAGRLLELLQEIYSERGVDGLKELEVFHWERTNEDWNRLRESYSDPTMQLHDYHTLVGNNIFYTITGEVNKVLPVLMVNLEFISIHADAGYPKYRLNPAVTKGDERRFLLRALADTIRCHNENSLLVKESNKPSKWDKNKTGTDYRMQASKIIWGFERHKGVKVKPTSNQSFWKKNAHQWWSAYKDCFAEESDNKPYEVVSYDVMMHPCWEKDLLAMVDKKQESTAFWS